MVGTTDVIMPCTHFTTCAPVFRHRVSAFFAAHVCYHFSCFIHLCNVSPYTALTMPCHFSRRSFYIWVPRTVSIFMFAFAVTCTPPLHCCCKNILFTVRATTLHFIIPYCFCTYIGKHSLLLVTAGSGLCLRAVTYLGRMGPHFHSLPVFVFMHS